MAAPRFENRLNQILVLLNREGVTTDDVKMYDGVVSPNMMRQRSYRLVQIPRLNREILVCDQIGEASFVGNGQRGPLFWATYRKEFLEMQPDVSRVEHRPGWEEQLLDLLTSNNPIQPKLPKPKYAHYSLTEDIILVKAIEYAAAHDWRLPIQHSGEVEGLPGQKWANWYHAIRKRHNSLTRKDCRGLNHLFQIYGLKMGKKENVPLIKTAHARIMAGEPHGLKDSTTFKLSEDLIITKSLEYAAAHDWKLPTRHSGEVEGLPGQKWQNWNAAIRKHLNGLTRKDCKGLNHFFQIYGLKMGYLENASIIREAYTRIAAGKPHGLKDGTIFKLSEDLIITKGLEYAAAHDWRLPTQHSDKKVEGLPGQKWKNWDATIRKHSNGLLTPKIAKVLITFSKYIASRWEGKKMCRLLKKHTRASWPASRMA